MGKRSEKAAVIIFRLLSVLIYLADATVGIGFAWIGTYFTTLIGSITAMFSFLMLFVTIRWPKFCMNRIDTPHQAKHGSFIFTFTGRLTFDIMISLLLFAMGMYGIIAGSLTLILIVFIRCFSSKDVLYKLFLKSSEDNNRSCMDVFRPTSGSSGNQQGGGGDGDYQLEP